MHRKSSKGQVSGYSSVISVTAVKDNDSDGNNDDKFRANYDIVMISVTVLITVILLAVTKTIKRYC